MITWSPLAANDYQENIEFLLRRWSEKEAIHFIETTDTILDLILRNPLAFRSTAYENVRAVVILPQITLYYRAQSNGNIELIRFWNNHQDPMNLGIKR